MRIKPITTSTNKFSLLIPVGFALFAAIVGAILLHDMEIPEDHQASTLDHASPSPPTPSPVRLIPDAQDEPHHPTPSHESPLDALQHAHTVSEMWLDPAALPDGQRRRIRIAKHQATDQLLRIEEVVMNTPAGSSIHVRHATEALHVLAESRHLDTLTAANIDATLSKSRAYIRIPIPDPHQPDAIPTWLAKLKALGVTDACEDGFALPASLPGDPAVGSGLAWHLHNRGTPFDSKPGADINALEAWKHQTDASSVLVAVLDTGIHNDDLDLAESIYSFPGEIIGDGVDNDGNGYIDDTFGYDFADNDPFPTPRDTHATQCALLIGGRGGNEHGSCGVAWKASLLNCKVFSGVGLGAISSIVDAIDYSIASGARILNMSWTYDGSSPILEAALKRANQAGVIVVCSAGNRNITYPLFKLPARIPLPGSLNLPLMVTVAASQPDNTLADFTLVDPMIVDLAAPGVLLQTGQSEGLPLRDESPVGEISGTSQATALVTGALALTMARHPDEPPSRIVRRLLESVDPMPGAARTTSTGGRLNVGKMLTISLPEVPHDQFTDRRILIDASGQWIGNCGNATTEALDRTWALKPVPSRTLWFEWTAPDSGNLTLSAVSTTKGSAIIRAFRVSGGLPSTLAASSLNGRPTVIPVTRGEKLFWMADGSSQVKITWNLPPPNDNWENAPTISSIPAAVTGSTLGATPDKFESSKLWHRTYFPSQSIWWKFIPHEDMEVVLSVSDPKCMAFLLPATAKTVKFPKGYDRFNQYGSYQQLKAGKTYAILAIPGSVSSAGPVTLSLTRPGQLAMIPLSKDHHLEIGESFALQAPVMGHHGPYLPTGYQWYRNGLPLQSPTSNSRLSFNVTPESFGIYHVTMTTGGITQTSGAFRILPREEAPRVIASTIHHRILEGERLQISPTIRPVEAVTYTWKKNGHLLPGETGSQLQFDAVTPADAGAYSLIATNRHGTCRIVSRFSVNVRMESWG